MVIMTVGYYYVFYVFDFKTKLTYIVDYNIKALRITRVNDNKTVTGIDKMCLRRDCSHKIKVTEYSEGFYIPFPRMYVTSHIFSPLINSYIQQQIAAILFADSFNDETGVCSSVVWIFPLITPIESRVGIPHCVV